MNVNRFFAATALATSLLLVPAVAQAQTTPADETTAAEKDDEDIVVVGSRIRRDEFNTADPIQVITREDATQAGFNSTADLLQSTAVTGGSAQINNAFGGFVTAGGPGANTLSLRGLGATRTLVLLNGRRVSPAGSRGQVGSADLNVLPSAALDRVEILNTGASSIYGSDAIAGVVNLVTRTNVDGIILEGQVNVPEVGAGVAHRLAAVFGTSGDRWNFMGSVEYYNRGRLTIGDVDFTQCQQSLRRTNATAPLGSADFIDPRTGQSKCYPTGVTGESGVTVNTIGTPDISSLLVDRALGVPAAYAGVCNRYRPDATAGGAVPGYECVGGGTLNLNVRDTFTPALLRNDLISPAEIYTGFIQGAYELDALGGMEIYAELLANRRKSSQLQNRQFTIDYALGSPLIPANLQFPTQFLPAQAGGITGTTPIGIRVFADYGNYENRQTVDFVKGVVGARGTLFGDWRYDAYAMKSWSDAEYTTDLIITSKLAQSLDVVPAAGGGFACRNTLGGCVAAPAITPGLVAGNFPANWFNYVVEPVTGVTKYRERVLNFTVDGPLFQLPGGMVQVAMGVEQREASIDDTPSPRSVGGDLYSFTSSSITRGSDSVWEVFGELEVPLLADIPGIHRLTFNGSARYTDYRSYGGQTTYKVGGLYAPVEFFSFRGSYGTSYRAPALFEQFLGSTSGFQSQNNDVCNNYGNLTAGSNRAVNCASLGLPATFQATTGIRVNQQGGAATGLSAETSKNLTFGGVLNAKMGSLGNLSFAVDYFDIKVENGVSQLGFATILAQCYDSAPADFTANQGTCSLIQRTTTSPFGLTVTQGYVNISNSVVKGIDFNARYNVPVFNGQFRLNAQVTKFDERYSQTLPTDTIRNSIKTLNNPEWTGTFDASFTLDKWNLRYGVEWIDGTNTPASFLGTTQAVIDTYDFKAEDYFLHTLSMQYRGEKFGMTLGVRNLLDASLPTVSSGSYNRIGNVPLYSGYDYVGRQFFVNVTTAF
ncbi:TonB-dependent receptor plug domain-containing protein [Sphingomonas sp. LT1P40]|uniref:TonB-dependent receptor plug domain-containing protein n=1 Tax=Alteristakelama amylovorans TaxID=3096166 RepID=UPI002FC6DE24